MGTHHLVGVDIVVGMKSRKQSKERFAKPYLILLCGTASPRWSVHRLPRPNTRLYSGGSQTTPQHERTNTPANNSKEYIRHH
jgi:hypothetical protein